MPGPALSNHITSLNLLFGQKARTQRDALVPQVDGGVEDGGLNTFVERQHQITLREVRDILAMRHTGRQRVREKQNKGSKRLTRRGHGERCSSVGVQHGQKSPQRRVGTETIPREMN